MASPPVRLMADPLLEPDAGPRDASGAPVRAPIGNSIRTLLLLGLLVVVGIGVWWARQPEDLTERIGGRQWVIVDVDGMPADNDAGRASTFVLDGTHEVRGMDDCNTQSGRWAFDTASQWLSIEWGATTLISCPDWATTYSIASGSVRFDDVAMTVDTGAGEIRSIPLSDMRTASADELAGRWSSGDSSIELGSRGLVRVDGCSGSWMAVGKGITVRFEDAGSDDCPLAPIWADESVIVPVRFEDSLYFHRDMTPFPLDREVQRLDLKAAAPA